MSKALLTSGLLLLLFALGTTDALLTVKESPLSGLVASTPQTDEQNQASSESSTASQASTGGVAKMQGPDVEQVVQAQGFSVQPTREPLLIAQIIPPAEAQVETRAVLQNGDRAGVIAWSDSPKVKIYFLALKEALHSSFTPAVKELRDESQRRAGKPPRNFLTFHDTGISTERIVFVRIRERLYEMRIAPGKDAVMLQLMDALTE